MDDLRRNALAAGGWALLGLGLAALGFIVYEGFVAGGSARGLTAGAGAGALLLLRLLWRRLSLGSRVHLV